MAPGEGLTPRPAQGLDPLCPGDAGQSFIAEHGHSSAASRSLRHPRPRNPQLPSLPGWVGAAPLPLVLAHRGLPGVRPMAGPGPHAQDLLGGSLARGGRGWHPASASLTVGVGRWCPCNRKRILLRSPLFCQSSTGAAPRVSRTCCVSEALGWGLTSRLQRRWELCLA